MNAKMVYLDINTCFEATNMIIITDGKDRFSIDERALWNRKEYLQGLAIKLKYDYWCVELLFVRREEYGYEKIVKCYVDGDSYIREYVNLNRESGNIILLEEKDYKEVKTLYKNMISSRDYRKEAIVEAGAILFSYEYYQNYILEDGFYEISADEIFDLSDLLQDFKQYKKEIFKKAKILLKEKYGINFSF